MNSTVLYEARAEAPGRTGTKESPTVPGPSACAMDRTNRLEDEPARLRNERRSARSRSSRDGFTLIEVLAAMLLIAIALPAVMKGIAAASSSASSTRHRSEAAGLAEAKLNELVVSNDWQGSLLAGDFGQDWPEYRWQATVQAWPLDTTSAGIQELDLRVIWMSRGQEDSLMVSTLVYARSTATGP